MHRIDTPTVQTNEHGTGKHGFTNGDAGLGVAPTDLDAAWFDAVQEELASLVERMGITLAKGTHTQLFAALQAMLAGGTATDRTVLGWTDTTEAQSVGDHVRVIAPEAATSDRTLLWRTRIGAGVTEPRQIRIYAAANQRGTDGPALELTVNAAWDGSTWARDGSGYATMLSVTGSSMRFSRATGSSWADSDWLDTGRLSDGGDLTITDDLVLSSTAGNVEYSTRPTRTVYLPMTAFYAYTGWFYAPTTGFWQVAAGSTPYNLSCGLNRFVPHNATITAISVHGQDDGTLTGPAMDAQVIAYTHTSSTFGIAAPTSTDATAAANLVFNSGSTGHGTIDLTGLNVVINSGSIDHVLRLRSGATTDGSGVNRVYAVRVTYTDPGPRNH